MKNFDSEVLAVALNRLLNVVCVLIIVCIHLALIDVIALIAWGYELTPASLLSSLREIGETPTWLVAFLGISATTVLSVYFLTVRKAFRLLMRAISVFLVPLDD